MEQNLNIKEALLNRVDHLEQLLLDRTDGKVGLIYREVPKNNNTVRYGYEVTSDSDIRPFVHYNEKWFNMDDDDVVGFLLSTIKKDYISPSEISDPEYVYANVRIGAVNSCNTESYKERDIYFWENLGLVFYYYVIVSPADDEVGSYKITRTLMENLDPTFLYFHAEDNMRKSLKIESLAKFILGIHDIYFDCEDELDGIMIVTNTETVFGAGILAIPYAIMDRLDSKHDAYYVIPSSIHEVLIVPALKDVDPTYLENTISTVNSTTVSVEERLSDSLYYLDLKSGTLHLA